MTDKTSELTAEQKELVNKIMNKKLEQLKTDILKRVQEIAQTQVAKLLQGMANKNFADLPLEVLSAVVMTNAKLNELQKSQILAILQGPKHDFTYFG